VDALNDTKPALMDPVPVLVQPTDAILAELARDIAAVAEL
jgi:hypothetical protein